MTEAVGTAHEWAREVFGRAALGDARRMRRLVRLATAAAERSGWAIPRAVVTSTAWRCAKQELTFVAVDGTSLSLTDRACEKDFGLVGVRHMGVRGLKFINAYAIRSRWHTSRPLAAALVAAPRRERCGSDPISSVRDVQRVVFGYQQRWRIEELHKTWKSGACGVEETQLRSADASLR